MVVNDEIPADLYPTEADLPYEEEILRDPFKVKGWWRYLVARASAPFKKRSILYERALKALPGSYKLWHAYLRERLDAVRPFPITHPSYSSLNNTFERALVTMHRMPRIWIMYLSSLTDQRLLTRARRTFDRALRALPVTQHDRVWPLYLKLVSLPGVPVETSFRVYRRYLAFDPSHVEDFIDFLLQSKRWQEAADRLASVLNDDSFYSIKGKTKHQLWLELCDLLTKHATEILGLKVDPIIRGGIRKFTDEVGRLWTSLADYYVRRGLYEKARDIFEEGISTVITVRDFSVIFDAYAQFEQSALAAKLEAAEDDSEDEMDDGEGGKDGVEKLAKKFLEGCWLNDDDDTDLRLARFERLFDRRPELLNSVLLRQNPHNVEQWHRRVKLFEGDLARQASTYVEAVKTVDPAKAVGKPHTLWIAFAKMYEEHNRLDSAEEIFKKATQVNYKAVDHLATVWCEWAEMELRHKNFTMAIELMQQATAEPSVEVKRRAAAEGNEPVQMRLHKSLRLWSFYVDLEESLGTLESTCAVYERILDLRIATPQIILNYAFLLEENKYFEDAFKVYERGVKIFKYPHVRDIWVTYLSKFVKRYGKSKLDRARELFEQAIEQTPAQEVKPLFLQYAKLEEDYGLAKRAMNVYDRAVKAVADNEKLSMYEIYIARAAEIYGVPKTRQIYEQAIESGLPPNAIKSMCLKYAELERNLGEIDRARAIFVFASNYADPRSDPDFWKKWKDFEIQHGNEDTFREMLRISRSVTASYSQTHFILPEYLMQKDQKLTVEEAVDTLKRAGLPEDQMSVLERQLGADSSNPAANKDSSARAVNFVRSEVAEPEPDTTKMAVANAEEIDLPESDSDDENIEIAQKSVPAAVFGELANKVTEEQEGEDEGAAASESQIGALERIKRQRRQ
ncbi:pre-mRNA-splicing factor SYF1-like protein [Carex littledalei]|uniref:Pre-mRNA-splicing factor SYF1 n=1 Tax=Carex littledalei TaxID=544730 RepID=A0A833VDG7_9POAL|nr:pre-mRNA-splicing factor SYF1-like protein [Carex littledalei]